MPGPLGEPPAPTNTVVRRLDGLPPEAGAGAIARLHGTSSAIERIRGRIRDLARAGARVVVVQGEPGSGKRRVAMCLHACGSDPGAPFWEIEAGLHGPALPEDSGTLLVRNIDRAGAAMISSLVAAAYGGARRRLVLLTRVPLGELRARSLEHGQLLGAAARAAILVPPLRARRLDIAELARVLAQDAAARYDRPARGLSPGALARLEAHDFPGNVRQLRSLVEIATLQATGDWITAEAFSGLPSDATAATEPGELTVRLPGASLRQIELEVLRLALRITRGRVVKTAELLGITRHALRRKLEKHGLGDLRARGPEDDDGTVTPRVHEDTDATFA
jgi:DNA-binding NtrC family response regulator